MLAVIALVVGQVLAWILAGLLARWWIRRRIRDLVETAENELNLLCAGKECHTGAILSAVARTIGQEAGRSAKAALMADLSHISREQGQQQADQQLALIQDQAPGVAGVLAGMGAHGRGKIFKNPFVQLAIQALTQRGNHTTGPDGPSVRDRLQKGG